MGGRVAPENWEYVGKEDAMSTSVAKMTKADLQQMIAAVVEEKLLDLLGDPDARLVLKKSVRDRLIRQKKAVARGDRGELFARVPLISLRRKRRPT